MLIAVATSFAGCAWSADRAGEAGPTSGGRTTVVPRVTPSASRAEAPIRLSPTAPASPIPADQLVALVVADAARRTSTSPDSVRIVRVEAREWPDRSLGCPRPGMGYAQAITPGYLIVVEAAGQSLEYHTDSAQVALCAP